ncbi:MAG: hypothetical protein ABI892_19170 [Flavobacterium sp.]
MLENSFGMAFFFKTAHKGSKIRAIHLRITVDGITKETSTKRKIDFIARHINCTLHITTLPLNRNSCPFSNYHQLVVCTSSFAST